MRILVTFAVDWEFRPWTRLRPFRPVPGNERLFRTQIAESDVRVVMTGIGQFNAVRSIRAAVDEAPDLCIASGLTGGLKREHRPGEVLVARAACAENGGEVVESDERLFDAAVECGAKAVNQFVSAGRTVRTAKEKSEFHPWADAVDMESFAIMKEMSGLGVPCVAVRSVGDSAEMEVPCDFDRALDASGRIRLMQVLGQVVSNPRRAWPLARFGAQSSRAASLLSRYLDGYTAFLATHQEKLESSVQQISQ
jgi:nucleoside phosphorylase